jgi:HEAT repeats
MREPLVDLIAQMTAKEPRCIKSDESVSWHAHREAELLADASMVEDLADYVRHESNKEHRGAAYFILGELGKKVGSAECASILVSHVGTETNKYALAGLLDALGGLRKPRDLDLHPVFQLLHDERWLVRHSAIQALRLSDSPEVEARLLEHLDTTSDPHDMTYCHATLSEIGTAKALPAIERNLKARKRDVKDSAQFAINAINARGRSDSRETRSLDTP